MNEYVTAIAAVVSGIFAVAAAVISWKLKVRSEKMERVLSKERELQDELKSLYTSIFVGMEQTIKKVLAEEAFALDKDLSEINAKVRLLASPEVADLYCEAADLLGKWSSLHARATPRKMTMGDRTVTILQAPDPTQQYKKPAENAHEKLQGVLEQLVARMRAELREGA